MAFVVSEGSLRSIDEPVAQAPYAVRLSADLTQDYATIWRTQGSVRTVVSFLARNIASLGLHTYRRVSDTDRVRVTDHPFTALLARPNPFTTRYRWIDALVHDLGIYDEANFLKVRTNGQPQALVRISPKRIKPVGDNWLAPSEYVIEGARGKLRVPADQVVHLHGYNPDDDRSGSSPLEALRQILVEEYEAGRMRSQVLRNGARTSGYLERPKEAPPWSPEAKNKFRAQWQAQYAGGGPEAGGTPILEDGMVFKPAAMTAEQLQYVEARKLTREEVAAAYFIPPPMVGILDHATFGNIEEQHKMLYQDTLGPWLQMIVEDLQLQLMSEFPETEDMYLEFNLAEKLRGSFEEQASSLQTSVGAPWLTRNEARARQNLPAVDGGDELVTPLNVLVGGQASPRDSGSQNLASAVARFGKAAALTEDQKILGRVRSKAATPAQRVKVEQVIDRFFERQGAAVLSAIGAGGAWWDEDRWNKELADALLRVSHSLAAILGKSEAERLGFPDGFDPLMIVNFLRVVAEARASGINATTKAQLDAALAAKDGEPAKVFETARNDRAAKAGAAVATFVAAFASVEAAKQIGDTEGVQPTKTWVTGPNPRSTHAAMDGETVPIGEPFSNGMDWPGQGDAEDAGCNCGVEINL